MRIHFYVRDMDGNISVHAPGLDEEAVREKMIVAMRQELVETYGEEAAGWDDDKVADEMGVCESAFFYMREIDLSYRPSTSGGGQIDPELEPFEAATAVWIRRGEFGRLHDWAGRQMKALDEVVLFHARELVEVEDGHTLELTLRGPCPESPTGFHFQERLDQWSVKTRCPFCGQHSLPRKKEETAHV